VKCIKCSTDNNLKDRRDGSGRCKNCRHEFAFDPKVMPGVDFTDMFFQQTLDTLSVNRSLFFTKRQFYYFLNQRRSGRKDSLKTAAGCAIPIAFILLLVLSLKFGFSLLTFGLFLLVVGCSVLLLASPGLRKRLRGTKQKQLTATPHDVDGWYGRWTRINGDSGKLLPPVSGFSKPHRINPELKNYSFDRAVVCERREIAQCLIANNFHFENNSAVLSLDGYPNDIFEPVMEMLRRNPDLSVYALHDASSRGVQLPHILNTDPRWFAGSKVKIFDLGLLPRQILDRSVFVEVQPMRDRVPIPEVIARVLLPKELQWLNAGNFVSLESFPPQVLLRVIAQGIAKSRDPQATDALVPIVVGAGAAGVYYYTWDSFG
jgi:hypothetical protein